MALDNSTRRGGTMVDWLVEMKEYVGFTADDERALAELLPRIEPHADGICDHFYECILRHPHAHAAITGGEKQVARLKKSLREWLLRGLSGSYDSDFYESRSRVGRMHVAIDLPQQFMFTAMNVIRLDLRAVATRLLLTRNPNCADTKVMKMQKRPKSTVPNCLFWRFVPNGPRPGQPIAGGFDVAISLLSTVEPVK